MNRCVGWGAWGEISDAVLRWRVRTGRPEMVALAWELGVGMDGARRILAARTMPSEHQRAVLERVVGVPRDAWER